MKRIILFFITLSIGTMSACSQDTPAIAASIQLRIGTATFTASLYDNPTAQAFRDLLPIAIEMSELNGNEKYCYLSADLPANAVHIGTIRAGDIMLYGDNCPVLFYETFTTSYRYTPIGHIEEASGLREAVGSGTVEVRFAEVPAGQDIPENETPDKGTWYDLSGRAVATPSAGIYLRNGQKRLRLP
ncbi:MAG: cyclophilin-like fold protein [Paludibacteraceae bacterium]